MSAAHLKSVFDELDDDELAERLEGFRAMLAELPDDDDTIRPTVADLASAIEAELREREAAEGPADAHPTSAA